VQKAAKRASIAVPVLAVSGALAAAPQALAATTPGVHAATSAATTRPISAQLDAAVHHATAPVTTYTVRPGDTLSAIALRLYGRANGWHELYRLNKSKISNPNLIFAGMVLAVPRHLSTSRNSGTAGKGQTGGQQSAGGSTVSSGSGGQGTGGQNSGSQFAGNQGSGGQQGSGAQQGSGGQQSSGGQQASAQSSSTGGSSTSLSSAVQQDVSSGNYLLAVGQYLVENGYSDAAAAGVASCVDGESGGNPESVGTGGGGLIGWTPIGSAAPNSNIITGNPAQDMMAQLSDLLYYNSTEIGQSMVDELNGQTDPVAAADFYSQNFEKPAVTDSDVVQSVAEQVYSQLSS
jgi:LysM repeat protein